MSEQDTRDLAKISIKKAIKEISWWSHLSEEVRKEIDFLIEHINDLGIPFSQAFRASCKFSQKLRKIKNQNVDPKESTVFFSAKLSEEEYQASQRTVINLLNLNEWHEVNEAEVQACRLLCEHIEILVSYNVLVPSETEPQESITSLLKKALLTKKPTTEETLED